MRERGLNALFDLLSKNMFEINYKLIHEYSEKILSQILQKDKHGSYICPKCGNGSGKDGTGLSRKYFPRYKCYKCEYFGDALDIIKLVYSLNDNDGAELAYKIIGVVPNTKEYVKPEISAHRAKYGHSRDNGILELVNGQLEYDRAKSEIIERASKDDRGITYAFGRGIPMDISRAFRIGYIEGYNGIERGVLIPLSKDSFDVRNIDPCDHADRYRKCNGKQKINIPFNLLNLIREPEKPFFVTEGEFDALSIISAGYPAVALNGNAISQLIDILNTANYRAPVGVLMDNDDAGKDKTELISSSLKNANIPILRKDFYEETHHSDPNEFYQYDRKEFKRRLKIEYDHLTNYMINFMKSGNN